LAIQQKHIKLKQHLSLNFNNDESLTSKSGGDDGGVLAACFITKVFRRMSVPAGGPSK
jgi:hypothetical protein